MNRTPSKPRAALWMAGWLSLMLVVAIAGREATRELNVFQIMEIRSALGLVMLYPDPLCGRFCGAAHVAAADACSPQSVALCRPVWLVPGADADPAGPGGIDRIHHADLDRDPGRNLSWRAHHRVEGS